MRDGGTDFNRLIVNYHVQFIFYVINLLHKQRPPTQPSFSNRYGIRVLQKTEFVELKKCAIYCMILFHNDCTIKR
jgi:hypothetical protein